MIFCLENTGGIMVRKLASYLAIFMKNNNRQMATSVDEMDAAVQIVVSRLPEITTLKSTYFFDPR